MLQEKSNKQSHLGEKCILMLILLEINAFVKMKIQLSYLSRLWKFLSNIFLRLVVVTEILFVGMAIFHIFLILEEQISVESLVENQKSRLIFI